MYALLVVTKPRPSLVKAPGTTPKRSKAERLNACKLDLEGRGTRDWVLPNQLSLSLQLEVE